MEIKIITVGKIKEKYLNDGIASSCKRHQFLYQFFCLSCTLFGTQDLQHAISGYQCYI